MEIRFYIDPDTELPHVYQHGVNEQEAIEAFWSASQHAHANNGALMAVGQTQSGRYLRVIYRKDDDGIFILTAYDLGRKALRAHRRRQRRKRR